MSTSIQDTIALLRSNIGYTLGGTVLTCTSNLVTDLQRLTEGFPYVSIAWTFTGVDSRSDSNTNLYGYELEIWIRYHISLGYDEDEWMVGLGINSAEVIMRALGDPAFYLLGSFLAGRNLDIYGFQADRPLVTVRPTREGNIISLGAEVRLLLVP
jgi:hypothetical protein